MHRASFCLMLLLASGAVAAQEAPTREHLAPEGWEGSYHELHYTPVLKIGDRIETAINEKRKADEARRILNLMRDEGVLIGALAGFAVLMGLSLSTIFLVYTGGSIAATFFATAGAFAGLSLFGYTTKKDLSGFGSFLIMGVVGLIIASLLNIWLQSSGLSWAISFLGVLIFAGLTAYDTQKLKEQYSGRVRFVFRQFPLSFHQQAHLAAVPGCT